MTRDEALEILGLDSDASLEDVRAAYRNLVKIYHPDKNSASNAAVMFRLISNAWDLIQNDAANEHDRAKTRQEQYEAEATRRQSWEESYHKRAEEDAKQKRPEKTRQQNQTKQKLAQDIHKRIEAEIEDKIRTYCYTGWFIYGFFSVCICIICIIGNLLGISRFSGFGGSEPLKNIPVIFLIFIGTFALAGILGWVTGSVINKIRRWFK